MITISKDSVIKNTLSGGLLITCGILGAVLVLLPIDITYKIGILAFILMAVFFFVNSFFAMMIFLFMRPSIEPLVNVQIVPGIPTVGFFALWIIVFLIFKFLTDRTYTTKIPNIGFLWLLLPFSIFSMFNSVDLLISSTHLLRLLGWISIYILIFNLVRTQEDAKKIIIVLILSSFIPLLIGYYQLFTHSGSIDELRGYNRVTSVFGNQPDTCAVFFSMIFFSTLIFLIQSKNLRKKILLSSVATIILAIFFYTYHRGSQLGLVVGVMAISVLHKKMLKVTIPLFLLVGIVFHAEIVNRIMDHFDPPKYSASSLSTRFDLWHTYLSLIPQHLFLGFGIGMAEVFKNYATHMVPHNDYVRLTFEIGIIGTLLYITFLVAEIRYYFLKTITNINKELNVVILALLIYFVVVSSAQNNFYNVNNMSILFSMLAVSKKLNILQMKSTNI